MDELLGQLKRLGRGKIAGCKFEYRGMKTEKHHGGVNILLFYLDQDQPRDAPLSSAKIYLSHRRGSAVYDISNKGGFKVSVLASVDKEIDLITLTFKVNDRDSFASDFAQIGEDTTTRERNNPAMKGTPVTPETPGMPGNTGETA